MQTVTRTVAASALIFCSTAPASAEPFKVAKTPGGLTFHYQYKDTTPYAAVNFGWRTSYGAVNSDKAGIIGLAGALTWQGADPTGDNEFLERLKDLGATASLTAGTLFVSGNVKAPAAQLPEAIDLIASALKTAEPSPKVFARVLKRAVDGEAQASISGDTIARRVALNLALAEHPHTRSIDPERYARVALTDLADWRRNSFNRGQMEIVVSGKISESDVALALDKAFGDLPEKPASPPYTWPSVSVPAKTVVVERPIGQSVVLMMGPTLVANGASGQVAAVANGALGGNAEARLWNALRTELGATYGAYSSFEGVDPERRFLTMRTSVDNGKVQAAIAAMRAAYAKFYDAGVTADELRSNASRLVNAVATADKEPVSANGRLLSVLLTARPADDITGYEDRMTRLTAEELNTAIKREFPRADQLFTVVVTPSAAGLNADCVIKSVTAISECRIK